MTELDKIEHRCKCGMCIWSLSFWVCRTVEGLWGEHEYYNAPTGYCSVCGYHLAADGFAYRMVRADEATDVCERAVKFLQVDFTPMQALACARMEIAEAEGSDE